MADQRPTGDAALPGRLRRARFAVALVAVVYAALAILLNIDVWQAPLQRYVGGGGDPQQTMWFLTWTPFALGHLHNPFVSNYMNSPLGINLLWNTSNATPGVLLWPITTVWNVVATYNVAMTLSLALSALFAFIAIRRWVPGVIAPAAGGLLYGFSPYMIAQTLGHTHVVASAITPPLALMLLDEIVIRQRMRPWKLAALTTALGVLQFFIAEEVFVTEIIAAAVVIVILAITHWSAVRAHLAYALRVLGYAAAATAVLLAYPVAVQLLGPARPGLGAIHSPDIFLTDPFNFVLPTSIQMLAPQAVSSLTTHFTGNISEWDGYLGIPLLVLLGYTLVRFWKTPVVRIAGLSGIVITVFSLGPHLHGIGRVTHIPLPWWIPAHLPLLASVQPNRLMLYVFLAAGIGLAFALQRLLVGGRRLRNWAAVAAVAVVALAPLAPRFPLASQAISFPAYFTGTDVQQIPDGTVAVTAPWASPADTTAMTWQFASGMRFRMVGGYVLGPLTPGVGALSAALDAIDLRGVVPPLDPATRASLLSELHGSGAQVVIGGPSPHQDLMTSFLTDLLGAAPQVTDGVDVWRLGPA